MTHENNVKNIAGRFSFLDLLIRQLFGKEKKNENNFVRTINRNRFIVGKCFLIIVTFSLYRIQNCLVLLGNL